MLIPTLGATNFLRVKDIIGQPMHAFLFKDYEHRTHPIGSPCLEYAFGVAEILRGVGADSETIAAALLYVLSSVSNTTSDDLKQVADDQVLKLVAEVLNLERYEWNPWLFDGTQHISLQRKEILQNMMLLTIDEFEGESQLQSIQKFVPSWKKEKQVENQIKLLLAIPTDIRALIIKLADRLQLMRLMNSNPSLLRQQKVGNYAKINLAIYAPLADRLGLWYLKSQLEDSAFQYLHPIEFEAIQSQLSQQAKSHEDFVSQISSIIERKLRGLGIKAKVSGREKHIYSIYRKMETNQLRFEEVNDLLGIRILVEGKRECYQILGFLQATWTPITSFYDGAFGRDWIKNPKENGYQSLHTTVSINGKLVEVQIRTHEMHEIAEYGTFAAHWRYKEGKKPKKTKVGEERVWSEQLHELHKILMEEPEHIAERQSSLFKSKIYVMTPKGHIVALTAGATPRDFAYHVHTDLGDQCTGAKVDNQLVPLEKYILKNGEIVEILYVSQAHAAQNLRNATLSAVNSDHPSS